MKLIIYTSQSLFYISLQPPGACHFKTIPSVSKHGSYYYNKTPELCIVDSTSCHREPKQKIFMIIWWSPLVNSLIYAALTAQTEAVFWGKFAEESVEGTDQFALTFRNTVQRSFVAKDTTYYLFLLFVRAMCVAWNFITHSPEVKRGM